jgi:hypothetical protein
VQQGDDLIEFVRHAGKAVRMPCGWVFAGRYGLIPFLTIAPVAGSRNLISPATAPEATGPFRRRLRECLPDLTFSKSHFASPRSGLYMVSSGFDCSISVPGGRFWIGITLAGVGFPTSICNRISRRAALVYLPETEGRGARQRVCSRQFNAIFRGFYPRFGPYIG